MNHLLTILAGTCLLLVQSQQQQIGAEVQEEVTPDTPVAVIAIEPTSEDVVAPSPPKEGDKPKGNNDHSSWGGHMDGKGMAGPGGMKAGQKNPMGGVQRIESDKMAPAKKRPSMMKPIEGMGSVAQKKPLSGGGQQGPMGGFVGKQPGAKGPANIGGEPGFGGMRRSLNSKPQ